MTKWLLYQKHRTTSPASPEEQKRGLVKYLKSRGLNHPDKEPAISLTGPLPGTAYGKNFHLNGR